VLVASYRCTTGVVVTHLWLAGHLEICASDMHRAQHCWMALTKSPCVGEGLKPTQAGDIETFTCVSKRDWM
jgi:hypothetical protein